MPQRRARLWILLAALALLALAAAAGWLGWRAWSARTPRFHDDFTHDVGGRLRSGGWQAFGGSWQVANGEMRNLADDRGAKLLNGNRRWRNYIVESDVQLLAETGDAGFVLRTNSEEIGVDAYHGYFAGLRDLDDTLILGRADFGWHEYAAVPFRLAVRTGTWYHLRAIVFDCVIGVTASGAQGEFAVTAIHDPECIPEGRFGLQSYSTGAIWRNVQVRPATAEDLRQIVGSQPPPEPVRFTGEPSISNIDYFRQSTAPIWRELRGHRSSLNAEPIANLRLMAPDRLSQVTVQGVVTLLSPELVIQDSTGGISLPAAQTSRPLQIGDAVEATGQAEMHDFSSVLRYAEVRPLWSHADVPPVSVSAAQAASGSFDARYIATEGVLSSVDRAGGRKLLLRLSEGNQDFEALTEDPNPDETARGLEPGSRLRLQGICVTDRSYTRDEIPFALLLRSAGDVQILKLPSWWNTEHIVELGLVLLLLTVGSQMLYASAQRAQLRAVMAERERLALEMHDTLAQSFAGLGFQIEALAHEAPEGSPMRSQLESSLDLVRFGHTEARRNIAALRPGKLELLGLARALEQSARSIVQGGPIAVELVMRGEPKNIPLRLADPLFRIGQEAIANAVRHGRPSRIQIQVVYGRARLKLTVRDNGLGFVPLGENAGFGIRGMKLRADSIGANLKIRSQLGNGTSVSVRALLPQSRFSAWWLGQARRFSRRRWFHA